jgi:phosphoribosylformylglycinamidine synthase PurS subunit
MALFLSRITVTLRKSILDPQGKAVEHGIHSLGYNTVENVRIGKFIELSVGAASRQEAERVTRDVCQKLLANPVMEDFSFVIEEQK